MSSRTRRDHRIRDATGTPLLEAAAILRERDIVVTACSDGTVVMRLRRRRLFPLTGRVDVLDADGTGVLGVVTRGGRFRDGAARTRGRFRDPHTLGKHLRQELGPALIEALLGGDGATDPRRPEGYALVVNGAPVGSLVRARLPFPLEGRDEAPRAPGPLGRLLPERVRRTLRELSAPRGWRLERRDPPEDPRLELAAALLLVELSHW